MATGLLRRLAELRRSDDDLAADELRVAASAHGCAPVAQCHDREVVTVAGSITSVSRRPKGSTPALVAELWDGSTPLALVWLGRRCIHGVEPGAYLKATGLLCHPKGTATIFNPAYELLPGRGDADG